MPYLYKLKRLPKVIALGYSVCPQNWRLPERSFSNVELIVVTKGSFWLVCEEQRYHLFSNDCFIMAPNTLNTFYTESEECCEFYYVHFEALEEFFRISDSVLELVLKDYQKCIQPKRQENENFWCLDSPDTLSILLPTKYTLSKRCDKVFSLFEDCITRRDHYNAVSVGLITSDIIKLLFLVSESYLKELNQLYTTQEIPKKSKIFIAIQNYIHDNYTKIDCIKEVAWQFNISHQYLIKLFKESLHQTPTAYLNQIRIAKAKDLMRNTTLSITEISYQIGMNNPYYFSRLFKQIEQESPREFRKRIEFSNNQ